MMSLGAQSRHPAEATHLLYDGRGARWYCHLVPTIWWNPASTEAKCPLAVTSSVRVVAAVGCAVHTVSL